MADWDTTDLSANSSRKSSIGSGLSNGNSLDDDSSHHKLTLKGGENLAYESGTDHVPNISENNGVVESNGSSYSHNSAPGTAKAKAAKSPYAPSTIDSVPEEEITIPNDGNISAFTTDQIANFFRCLKVDDRIISHLHRKNVDGKRFSRLKDSELENVHLDNPVVKFFRDKSSSKNKKKPSGAWIL